MAWLTIIAALVPLLEMLVKWLAGMRKEHGALSERQQSRLNNILATMEQVKADAVAMGCTAPVAATPTQPDPS